jgi:hypothetical protein
MKISRANLGKLIREEARAILKEYDDDEKYDRYRSMTKSDAMFAITAVLLDSDVTSMHEQQLVALQRQLRANTIKPFVIGWQIDNFADKNIIPKDLAVESLQKFSIWDVASDLKNGVRSSV